MKHTMAQKKKDKDYQSPDLQVAETQKESREQEIESVHQALCHQPYAQLYQARSRLVPQMMTQLTVKW